MSKTLRLDLFAEDYAHEAFLRPLVIRLANERDCTPLVSVRNGRGGHPKLAESLRLYQRVSETGLTGIPDLVVIGGDANCRGFAGGQRLIEEQLSPEFRKISAIACPDPHIELWYMVDPVSFQQVVGGPLPKVPTAKCERNKYKDLLRNSVAAAGLPTLLGGIDFAADLVSQMDIYRASKNNQSFRKFVESFRLLLSAHLSSAHTLERE